MHHNHYQSSVEIDIVFGELNRAAEHQSILNSFAVFLLTLNGKWLLKLCSMKTRLHHNHTRV